MGRTDLLLGDLSAWRPLVGTRRAGGQAGEQRFLDILIVGLTLASIECCGALGGTRRVSLDSAPASPTNFSMRKVVVVSAVLARLVGLFWPANDLDRCFVIIKLGSLEP